MRDTIQTELRSVGLFVAVIWGVFLIDAVAPFDLASHGLVPRTWGGLIGIPAMPFLHASWQHLTANTIPLFVLLVLLAGSQARSWSLVAAIVLLGGALLWIAGRTANHLGASGLIFGLIAFLVVAGIRQRRFVPLAISVGVSFFYGGSLVSGIIPNFGSHVSWDGHLCGAVAGVLIAWYSPASPQGQDSSSERKLLDLE